MLLQFEDIIINQIDNINTFIIMLAVQHCVELDTIMRVRCLLDILIFDEMMIISSSQQSHNK